MNPIILAAVEGEHEIVTMLPFPAIFFGVIALAVFAVMGYITWSYRDVANRHEHKVSNTPSNH